MSVEIARTADDKKAGMSVADLRLFLAEVDRAGITDETPVKAAVGSIIQCHDDRGTITQPPAEVTEGAKSLTA